MLAYVFWHWHHAQVAASSYEEALIEFHRVLSLHKPAGFRYSRVLVVEEAPWLGRTERTYEDWNIIEDSAALDPLNEGAVTGTCKEPHNRVAQLAEGGTAGLYRLQSGSGQRDMIRFAYRFNKQSGMSYAELYDRLHSLSGEEDVWVRQMTLGPGPEFCLHGSGEIALPESFSALKISVKQLWSGAHR